MQLYSTKYSETKDGFFVKMVNEHYDYFLLSPIKLNQWVTVVFPKNYKFIKDLPKDQISKLETLGWDVEKTIFLEIPYVQTFMEDLTPALVSNIVADANKTEGYFIVLTFTKGYLEKIDDIEKEDMVLHEKGHVVELLSNLDKKSYTSTIKIGGDDVEEESLYQERITESLIKKYGRKKVLESQKNAIIKAYIFHNYLPIIISGYYQYWVHEYLKDNFEKYKQFVHKGKKDFLRKVREDLHEKINERYKHYFNFEF